MRKIESLLLEYGESHQNPTNKIVHWICVPIIFWTVTALLWSVKLFSVNFGIIPELNLGMLAIVMVLLYYSILSVPLTFGMILYTAFCCVLNIYLEGILPDFLSLWKLALLSFVLAWIGQFWGHNIEGKKPSFLKDLQFLLIGPAWLMHFIYKRLGIKY